MREAMTQTLREALDAAQLAARELNQDFVGTEHLAIGLLGGDGSASQALRSAHADVAELKSALGKSLPRAEQTPVVTGALPLSPKSQRTLNDAIVKTQLAREPNVSTRFLLKALLDEPGTALCKTMKEAGVDLDSLQRHLDQVPSQPEE